MKEQIQKLWKGLVNDVFHPIRIRIKGLPWICKVLILLLGLLVIGYLKYPGEAKAAVSTVKYYYRASGFPPKGQVPLTAEQRRVLVREINNLTAGLQLQLRDSRTISTQNAWSIAQIVFALERTNLLDVAALVDTADKYYDAKAHGYFEYLQDRKVSHVHISAWMVLAWSMAGLKIDPAQVEFLLDQQNPNGWWAVFESATDSYGNASTFATAFTANALHNFTKRHPQTEFSSDISLAVDKAREWLLSHKAKPCVWYDYYFKENERMESLSISALTLHTLHQMDPNETRTNFKLMDKAWLQSLPGAVHTPTYKEVSAITVETQKAGGRRDVIRHYVLPWQVVATVDAYQNGNWFQRAQAQKWIDNLISSLDQTSLNTSDIPWVAAEFLFALKYLAGQKI
ncbi:MAG: hypothetical protein AB1813_05840 [Verrucomicrobiota bacterium]|jgi:hypothetical protein